VEKIGAKLPDWTRAYLQPAALLGLAMIGLIWAGVTFTLEAQREDAYQDAVRDSGNFARAFEDHVVWSIKETDQTLRFLRSLYEADPANFDLYQWSKQISYASGLAMRLGHIDAEGFIVGSTSGPLRVKVDARDREHYLVHVGTEKDELYIGKPEMSRLVSGDETFFLSRPMRKPDGRLAGVIVAVVSPQHFASFYDNVILGREGGASLVGEDGIFRVRGKHVKGRSDASAAFLDTVRQKPVGTFIGGWEDGTTRLVSYRKVRTHPLIVTVALTENHIYESYLTNRREYYAAATALTGLILIVMGFSIRHWRAWQQSEAVASEKSRELEVTLDNMSQGIVMIDADQNVAVMNRNALELLELPETFLTSRPKLDDIRSYQWAKGEFAKSDGVNDARVREFFTVGGRLPGKAAYERERPNGTVIEVHTAPLPEGGVVATYTNVTDRKRNEARIAHMARHDALTDLANRVLLHERLNEALMRLRRHGDGFSLLCIDLDQFKPINDTFGHPSGDTLLKAVAARLLACTCDLDTVARLGGDEFAILQTVTRRPTDASALTERILEAIRVPFDIDGHQVSIGASIGIAMATDPDIDADRLFRNADIALYRTKAEGRNGYRFFDSDMDVQVRKRCALEADLRKALVENEFALHFQPMIDLAAKSVSCAEALVRWQHPERGLVPPAEFIPIAEETGLIEPLGEWVLREACRSAAAWPSPIRIAVNLSPVQFRKPNLAGIIAGVLKDTGLSPARLELEITESVLLQENERNLATLEALHALGVAVALDDFGTGYWSLSYLRSFSFDKLKIDRSFIREMGDSADCAAIVTAVSGLGRALGIRTTAEGVETAEQLQLVRAAGFAEAQGYLFSRPLAADDFGRYLADHAGHVEAAA
jgi:diguanylate cyclase (GGDEF)-like protein